jgi:hypothetical protein
MAAIPRADGALNLGARFGISDSDAQILYFVASIVLAVVLVYVTAYYARRSAIELQRQNKLQAYERRAAVLRGVLRCLGLVMRDARVKGEVIPCLLEATSEREYLFDQDLCADLEEIYQKCVRAFTLVNMMEGQGGATLEALVNEEAELLNWLLDQPRVLRQKFVPYLKAGD